MKKAQIKIQEMAFVLIAIILLFGLVFVFFAKFELNKIRELAKQTREERAITLVRTIASMPEIRCSEETSEAACLDLEKVSAFNESSSLQRKYEKFWSNNYVTEIVVEEIVPSRKIYHIYRGKKGNVSYFSFFPLCSRRECSLAKLSVWIRTD
ncbi:MAG: hypothetical protein NZ889_01545 [Candidatus Pacearchaeota archaeon]|nr:hypothetical protein [Candidatus Pacearchaeota archaeon]